MKIAGMTIGRPTLRPRFTWRLPPSVARLARELAGGLAAAAMVTIFLNLGVLFVPLYDMILYDRVLQSRNLDSVTVLTVGCALGMLLYGLLEFCRSAMFVTLGDRLGRRLNLPALSGALVKSLEGDSQASAQAMRDLNQLRMFATGTAMAIPFDLLWTPALIVVLFLIHPTYGIYALVSASILLTISLLTDLATRKRMLDANNRNARNLNDLAATLRQSELLDGLGLLPDVARRWKQRQATALADVDRASRRSKAFASAAKTVRIALQAGVTTLGVVLVMRHEASPGSMMGANLIIARLLMPLDQLVSGWREWMSALGSWQRILKLVSAADSVPGQGNAALIADGDDNAPVLVVRDLTFSPPGMAHAVLDDVCLSLVAGEVVAIVGPSGSGKSTLARLIVGLFRPTSGHVEILGRDVHDWDAEALGARIGYLPQTVGLLDGTILENVARMSDGPAEAAIDAATRSGVHDLIGRLPLGYGTWVGANGHVLSGGQRQRIGLARALYGNPSLLVLDEPNANLDHVGEAALLEAISGARLRGAAVLLVTHRPAALAVADRVVAMRDGRITGITDGPAATERRPMEAVAS